MALGEFGIRNRTIIMREMHQYCIWIESKMTVNVDCEMQYFVALNSALGMNVVVYSG